MTMTREDVLRELELLPVWKLRTPAEVSFVEPIIAEKTTTVVVETLPVASKTIAPIVFEMTVSQDKKWAFISKPTDRMDTGLQAMLFSGILQALHIDKPVKSQLQNLTVKNLADIKAQVIVAMGEAAAQALLNSQDPIEKLRGKLHAKADSSIVVTYDLPHLLANPLDKAKTWQDLCLARSGID